MDDRSLYWADRARLAEVLPRARTAIHREGPSPRAAPRSIGSPRPLIPPESGTAGRAIPAELRNLRGDLGARLERFASWVREVTGASSIFVLDEDGLTLVARQATDQILALGPILLSSVDRLRTTLELGEPSRPSLILALGDHEDLWLSRMDSPIGRVSLGVVASRPIEIGRLEAVPEALAITLREER